VLGLVQADGRAANSGLGEGQGGADDLAALVHVGHCLRSAISLLTGPTAQALLPWHKTCG